MPELPIHRMILYKHGVGYFERRGQVNGAALRLSFPREAMDDVLKSLIALDLGAGHVHGVDFETPEDRAAQIARGSIHLSDDRSLLDLLRDLRGRRVRLWLEDERDEMRKGFGLGGNARRQENAADPGSAANADPPAPTRTQAEGLMIGIDVEDSENLLRAPIVSVYQIDQRRIRTFAVRDIKRVELLDDRSDEDLTYFLRAAQSEEDRRAATLRLSEGEHDLLVGYIAPAPAWRVSYRILIEADAAANNTATQPLKVLLQGWGLFDNQLDEDLENVTLTLVAGMPVSFRYRLYEPHTPERPLIADEERTVTAPIEFAAAAPPPPPMMAAPAPVPTAKFARTKAAAPSATQTLSMDEIDASTATASTGEERGALFQYRVTHPVSVARGQSAMVPIVAQRSGGQRELLYNSRKLAQHPVASLRMHNETGLTLERGPVTVIELGDYAGEAIVPFTRAGNELIIPYAVELGITIKEEYSSDQQLRSINVRNDYLLCQEWDIQHTLYRIHSTLADPVNVMIEQALLPGYTLTQTADPTEQTQGIARWAVQCAANSETIFTIHQRKENARWEQVRNLNVSQLHEFLEQRFLDQSTFGALSGVLSVYTQIANNGQRIEAIARERNAIYKQQQQIQGSLGPLGREGDEGQLRTRYVATLGELEDRLVALTNEEQQLHADNARLEQEAKQQLAALTQK